MGKRKERVSKRDEEESSSDSVRILLLEQFYER